MPWFRLRYAIGHEGWSFMLIVAFVLVGAVFRDVNLLILLVGMLAGPFLFNWRMVTLAVNRIEVRRFLPARVCAGELLTVELAASSPRLPFGMCGVTIVDQVQPEDDTRGDEPVSVTAFVGRIAREGEGRATYRCLLTRRGRYRFGPCVVSTRFPFGLVRASRRILGGGDDRVLVCPRLGRMTAAFSEAVESDRAGARQARPRRGFKDGDYYALREWRSGDSQRWIHWRTSAKMDRLIVREFEDQRHRDLALLADLWRPAKADDEDLGRVELVLSLVATLVAETCRKGSRQFALALAGEGAEVASGMVSPLLAQDLMDRMAVVQGSAEPKLDEALPRLMANLRRDSRLIIVTTNPRRLNEVRQIAAEKVADAGALRMVHEALWLDVSDPSLARFFQVD